MISQDIILYQPNWLSVLPFIKLISPLPEDNYRILVNRKFFPPDSIINLFFYLGFFI